MLGFARCRRICDSDIWCTLVYTFPVRMVVKRLIAVMALVVEVADCLVNDVLEVNVEAD